MATIEALTRKPDGTFDQKIESTRIFAIKITLSGWTNDWNFIDNDSFSRLKYPIRIYGLLDSHVVWEAESKFPNRIFFDREGFSFNRIIIDPPTGVLLRVEIQAATEDLLETAFDTLAKPTELPIMTFFQQADQNDIPVIEMGALQAPKNADYTRFTHATTGETWTRHNDNQWKSEVQQAVTSFKPRVVANVAAQKPLATVPVTIEFEGSGKQKYFPLISVFNLSEVAVYFYIRAWGIEGVYYNELGTIQPNSSQAILGNVTRDQMDRLKVHVSSAVTADLSLNVQYTDIITIPG